MARREFPALNLDDVPDGINEPERAARLGLGVDNMVWGSEYLHSESTVDQSQSPAGVPDGEQAKPAGPRSGDRQRQHRVQF